MKDSPWFLIISLVVVTCFGSGGVVWQCQQTHISVIKAGAELREKEIAVYRDILALADSYAKVYDEYFRTDTPAAFARRTAPINAQIEMRTADYEMLEGQLATLENRKPRKIPLDFLKPGAVENLKLKP